MAGLIAFMCIFLLIVNRGTGSDDCDCGYRYTPSLYELERQWEAENEKARLAREARWPEAIARAQATRGPVNLDRIAVVDGQLLDKRYLERGD